MSTVKLCDILDDQFDFSYDQLFIIYMVNLTFICSFSLISWVDNVNWPPSIVSKLTLRALALRQSDWRNCGLCVFAVFTRFKRRPRINAISREFMVLEKCDVMFTGQTRLSKGNFPFNLDNILSIVQFPLTARARSNFFGILSKGLS